MEDRRRPEREEADRIQLLAFGGSVDCRYGEVTLELVLAVVWPPRG